MGTVKNKTKISPGDGAVMMYVPEGNFLMGSSDGQIQAAAQICSKFNLQDCEHRYLAEKPLHAVYLDAYWIDRTDVTNARYAKCVNAGACTAPHNKTHLTKAFFTEAYYDNRQFADFPVIYVDWNQADQYCQWAGRRLPTEAEWEKAARGTDGRSYPWGEGISCQKANYAQKKDKDNSWCFAGTTNVFYFAQSASPYGVLDMAGNVAQWVADWADESYYLNSPERNPGGPSSGQYRVMRGGSWLRAAPDVRSATRGWNTPDLNEDNLGFRCAVSAAPSN